MTRAQRRRLGKAAQHSALRRLKKVTKKMPFDLRSGSWRDRDSYGRQQCWWGLPC